MSGYEGLNKWLLLLSVKRHSQIQIYLLKKTIIKGRHPHPEEEAVILVRYLVNQPALPEAIHLYTEALAHHIIDLTKRQQKIWQFCLRNSWALPLVDAALAFGEKYSPVRKKIYIMLAILETQPAYNDHFLPHKRSSFFPVFVFFRLLIAGWRCIAGKVIIWCI
jgi:hypothetical protein